MLGQWLRGVAQVNGVPSLRVSRGGSCSQMTAIIPLGWRFNSVPGGHSPVGPASTEEDRAWFLLGTTKLEESAGVFLLIAIKMMLVQELYSYNPVAFRLFILLHLVRLC